MSNSIVSNILKRINQPDLVRLLSEDLSGTELNTLLLEVFSHKTQALTAPQLLNLYQQNRFVKPGDLPVTALREMEIDLLNIFQQYAFQPLDLSPVTVLGSCSVVATASQNKILSATRGTEVLADATNAIALHICDLKQRGVWATDTPGERLNFSNIHRHLRTQQINAPGFTPHFKIACLVTAGSDIGSFTFEKESLCEHITIMKHVFLNYFTVEAIRFRFLCRDSEYLNSKELARQVKNYVIKILPETEIDIIEVPEKENEYYNGIQYKIDINVNGKTFEIGDGGFVDWTQKILQNKKEKMLSTGIGFDFMYRIKNDQL